MLFHKLLNKSSTKEQMKACNFGITGYKKERYRERRALRREAETMYHVVNNRYIKIESKNS